MRPTLRTLQLLSALLIAALAIALPKWWLATWQSDSMVTGVAETLWWAAFATLCAVVWIDALLSRRQPRLQIERRHSENVALGRDYPVTLIVRNRYSRHLTIALHDRHPTGCDADAPRIDLTLFAGKPLSLEYHITPHTRGAQNFGRTDVMIPGPLGLWQSKWSLGEETTLRVYPNFDFLTGVAMFETVQNQARLGIRQQHRRGEGMEFHQLREFRQGDSFRQIDWKASSRKNKLISKEYQDEKDQQIIFLLDSSRRMSSMEGDMSFFDHALHAMLMLSQVALKEGDSVGVLSFGAGFRWQKPIKSRGAMNTLLNHVYDLYPTKQAPDFSAAVKQLMIHHTKRALVVLMTNIDESDLSEVHRAMKVLQSKHLVMVANLEEPVLHQIEHSDIDTFNDALRYCAASELKQQQKEMTRRLQQSGVIAISTAPDHLPHELVNHYINVKRSHRL